MPDSTINHTNAGWPYLDTLNYIDVIPDYTTELADKLDNADADVAAAINAAQQAQAAAASVQAGLDALTDLNNGIVSINGTKYRTSGQWPSRDLSNPSTSQNGVHGWTVNVPLPYTPPTGWTFVTTLLFSNGFTAVGTGNVRATDIETRVINVGAAAITIRLGWQLIRIT